MGSVCTLHRLILMIRFMVIVDRFPNVPTRRTSFSARCHILCELMILLVLCELDARFYVSWRVY
jgi:hypothetical protein